MLNFQKNVKTPFDCRVSVLFAKVAARGMPLANPPAFPYRRGLLQNGKFGTVFNQTAFCSSPMREFAWMCTNHVGRGILDAPRIGDIPL